MIFVTTLTLIQIAVGLRYQAEVPTAVAIQHEAVHNRHQAIVPTHLLKFNQTAMAASWRPAKLESKAKLPQSKKPKRKGAEVGEADMQDEDEESNSLTAAGSLVPSKGGGKGKTRRGRRGKFKAEPKPVVRDKGLKMMISCMAKVSLQAAQNSRAALGVLVDSIMMPANDKAAKAISEEGEAFAAHTASQHETLNNAKKGTKDHDAALSALRKTVAPAKGNFCAFLEALSADDTCGKHNATSIKKYLADLGESRPDVTICKIKSIRDAERTMVLVSMRFVPIRAEILNACVQLGYEVKSDTPPSTAAEDELGAWLDSLG